MICPICGNASEECFCSSHQEAYQNLLAAYEVWHRAFEITWDGYLERVENNPNSGKWVREVCIFLLGKKI